MFGHVLTPVQNQHISALLWMDQLEPKAKIRFWLKLFSTTIFLVKIKTNPKCHVRRRVVKFFSLHHGVTQKVMAVGRFHLQSERIKLKVKFYYYYYLKIRMI